MTLIFVLFISCVFLWVAYLQTSRVWCVYRTWRNEFRAQRSVGDAKGTQIESAITPAANKTVETTSESIETAYQPYVAVVLCLRGIDPNLVECLSGLSLQEYSRFQLHVVVDDPEDPALKIVSEFFENSPQTPDIHIATIRTTCSLKCSLIVEALENIPPHFQIFAFIDPEIAPDQNWLEDLIAPLAQSDVGAVTGNRWFEPVEISTGAMVRQIWNCGTFPFSGIYNISWGSTFAIKRSTLEDCNLSSKWSYSLTEDTTMANALDKKGLTLFRIPNLISENSDSATLQQAYHWIVRQLVPLRLYHPKWKVIKLHSFATAMGSFVAPIALGIFYWFNFGPAFYLLALTFVMYQAWMLGLLLLTGWINRKVIDQRSAFNHQPAPFPDLLMLLWSFIVTQYCYPIACWTASRTTSVSSQGVDYVLGTDKRIKLRKYVPYKEIEPEDDSPNELEESFAHRLE